MIAAFRSLARIALAPLLLGACAAQEAPAAPEATGPVPVSIRLALAGETAPVLDEEGMGQIELTRQGSDEPVSLPFANGVLAVHELPPGRYEVIGLGPLQCRGLGFEVGTAPRYLGAIDAELVKGDYHVALMSPARVPAADIAALAREAGVPPVAVDAEPLAVTEIGPCFLGRDGPVTTWADLTLAEKIMLGVGVAGLCAISLAAGGFCQF